jgi:hypothetical protein
MEPMVSGFEYPAGLFVFAFLIEILRYIPLVLFVVFWLFIVFAAGMLGVFVFKFRRSGT